jgi:subtilisin family serine protease
MNERFEIKKILAGILIMSINACGDNQIHAQNGKSYYWIQFTDKAESPFTLERPEEFLSKRSLTRRIKQNVDITEQDLPVSPFYIQKISDLNIEIVNVSRWFNGAIIASTDTSLIDTLDYLQFVDFPPQMLKSGATLKAGYNKLKLDLDLTPFAAQYGFARYQLEMLNAMPLHEKGFQGEGMLIAIQDAGFTNANTISSLQHVWSDNRVIALKDFVKDGSDFFNNHAHGTVIFSILAGIESEYLFGSAPMAEYALIRTEDASTEYLIEEYNWVVGAEFSDSLGADVISSSLGYSYFTDATQNHSYADMDGKTTPISRAATIAASKGMLVVTSAGNSGGPPWFKITAPSDAPGILAIGAVDSAGTITGFSSRGPTFDQRIKPDVDAMGFKTVAQHPSGFFYHCSGTSCSAPLISGLAACLWQQYPLAGREDIYDAIIRSGSHYLSPDTIYGYGIPDFMAAGRIVDQKIEPASVDPVEINVFPNPFTDILYVELFSTPENLTNPCYLEFYDIYGRLLFQEELFVYSEHLIYKTDKLIKLPTGMYVVRLQSGPADSYFPITKIRSPL